ncbi:single-strand binding protein [Tenacibaculum skagerrakense]|uniref:Single-stranded DNA-binding protein n=1 Tax=Tenacibaculum skagerrakense TaxID=186571 RepID=A0A4R2P267_9FLAO|nr:single-stranded DNA-binding protein [Tenacibaculum skagerrakense]TCP28034.1 single-strand binding protein [Tenacibaculum skagerrakense]
MSGTVNKVILLGHLGDEVKMHYFEGGNSIGRFPLATNESYTNRQTGERIVNTDWHNIVVRNKLAEICEKYLSKGDRVYIEGRIKNRQYEVDGQKRYTTEIHVQDMTFLSTKKELNQSTNMNPSAPIQNTVPPISNEEDDLPF